MAQYSSVSTDVRTFGLRPYRNNSVPQFRYYEESTNVASNAIKAGHPVSFDTVAASNSGRIVRAPSSAGAAGDIMATTNIIGVAMEDSTSDGSTLGLGPNRRILVCLATDNQEFLGYLEGDLPNVSSMIGLQRSLSWDSTRNLYAISSTDSTAADWSVVVTDVITDQSSVGDTNGPVVVKFISTRTSPVLGRG